MVKQTQTIRRLLSTNWLSLFDHFVRLALKGLITSYTVINIQSDFIPSRNFSYLQLHCETLQNEIPVYRELETKDTEKKLVKICFRFHCF